MSRALLFALAFLGSWSIALADDGLVGTWELKHNEKPFILELKADGTGTMGGDPITWKAQGLRLEIGIDGEELGYAFKVDGNTLIVSGGDLEEPLTFTRKSGKKKGLGGMIGGGGEKEPPVVTPEPPVVTPKPLEKGIAGDWEATGPAGTVVISLKPDGTGSIGAQAFRYMHTEKTLTLSSNGEQIEYAYELKGDVLVLTGGDLPQPTEFKRKGAAAAPGPKPGPKPGPGPGPKPGPGPGPKPGPGPGPKPGPAPVSEKGLVGTWKSANETFEIRADGTILVNGNAVKYEVKGTTLTLVGPGGQVPYEFKLEGDTLYLTSDGTTDTYERVGGVGPTPGPAPGPGPKPGPAPAPSKGLLGTWESPNETIEIRADGTILVNGTTVKYEVKGSTLTLVGPQGQVAFEFTLNGDTLTLTSDGTTDTYQRVGAGGEED